MNIFIAAKYETRMDLWPVREIIRGLGCWVVSRWLDESAPREAVSHEGELSAALLDKIDIQRSDLFILDTTTASDTGGREVELGLAIAQGKDIWLVGPRRNVYHSTIRLVFDSWVQALGYLALLNWKGSKDG